MQVFFQGEPNGRHQVLPFVAVDEDGNWGVWYSDDRQGCSFGPYYGRRPDDPLASWRGMEICGAYLESALAFSEATTRACWDLGFDPGSDSAAAKEVRSLLGDAAIEAVHRAQVPDMDEALAYVIENDFTVSLGGVLRAVKAKQMFCSPLVEGCCTSGLLLVKGKLTREYQRALHSVQGGRSAGSQGLVRDYIERADELFASHLTNLERSFSKINKMLPGTEAATATVKQEKGLLQTITARFRRGEVLDGADEQAASLRKQIGMERIACGEALTNIQQNHANQHPYADMKMPNYHKSLMRFATGLLNFSNKLSDYLATNELAADVHEQTTEVRRNLDELRTWLNLSVNAELPGVYTLGLNLAGRG